MRTRVFPLAVLTVVLILVAGCNTLSKQPKINSASIEPEVLKPGDAGVIKLAVKDRHGLITSIEGVVLEAPQKTFVLRDDGKSPDEKADDNTWSMQVDVPFQAPPGEFTLEFTAFDKNGMPISIRDKANHVLPLKQVLPVRIEYTQQ